MRALSALEEELRADSEAGEALAGALRACANEESTLQARLRERADGVTAAEVAAQQARDHAAETQVELHAVAAKLGLDADPAPRRCPRRSASRSTSAPSAWLAAARRSAPSTRSPREEYREALERVEELEAQRADLETALRELNALIRSTDREIAETFEADLHRRRRQLRGADRRRLPGRARAAAARARGSRPAAGARRPAAPRATRERRGGRGGRGRGGAHRSAEEMLGVEIEVTPAGKSMKRLSLLSGGEKSMTAIAFLFAVFLARPCPFYILDEVEAALDDLNIDRFLTLLRRHCGRAQFIVVTHQKRTMEAADWLYGVSMGGDGTSKVVSRRLGARRPRRGRGRRRLMARDWSELLLLPRRPGAGGRGADEQTRAPPRLLPPPAREPARDARGWPSASSLARRSTSEALEEALILADVGAATAADIVAELEPRARRERLDADELRERLADAPRADRRGADADPPPTIDLRAKPAVILMVGVNGTGKTTTLGQARVAACASISGCACCSAPPTPTVPPRPSSSRAGRSAPAARS